MDHVGVKKLSVCRLTCLCGGSNTIVPDAEEDDGNAVVKLTTASEIYLIEVRLRALNVDTVVVSNVQPPRDDVVVVRCSNARYTI